jgi:hypothetical protein
MVSHDTLRLDNAYDYLSSAHVAVIGAGITRITTVYNLCAASTCGEPLQVFSYGGTDATISPAMR